MGGGGEDDERAASLTLRVQGRESMRGGTDPVDPRGWTGRSGSLTDDDGDDQRKKRAMVGTALVLSKGGG